jgi:predicted exporter
MSVRTRTAALLALMLAAAIAYLALTMRVDRDFVAFLPQGGDAGQQFLARQLRDSPAARLVLVRVSGDSPQVLAATSEALRTELAADPHFAYASNGSLAAGLADLPTLRSARYVLSPDAASHMSVDGLRDALRRRYEALGSSMAMLEKRWLADDPTGETLALLTLLQPASAPRREEGVWFDAAGRGAMLIAQTRAPASQAQAQQAAMQALADAFARVRTSPRLDLEYSSPGFLAARSETSIARDAERVSWMASLGIVAILCFVYRSLPIVLLCALPALAGLLAGLCAVTAGFGGVHAITLAFGATLIGEAVDYPSYVLTRYTAAQSIGDVHRDIRRPFVLAILTTACGALAFLASGVDGLVQLGVLTSCGIVVSGLVAWWIVPRLVPAQWRFRAPGAGSDGAWPRLRGGARLLLLGAITLALAAVATGKPAWNDDPARMSPLPPAAIALDQALRTAAGAPDVSRFALLRAPDVEAALQRTERLLPTLDTAVADGLLAGYDSVTRYLPSIATQRARIAALPDEATLRERLANAVFGSPFRADAFAPFLRDVAAARAAPVLTPASFAGTGVGLRVATLLGHDADGEWSIVPLRGVKDATTLDARLHAAPGGAELVDLHARTATMFSQFRRRTLAAIFAGALAITAILAIGLRSPSAAAHAIAPALLGTTWTALGVVAFGGGLSLFHLIALMLVLGIGVNYALFAQGAAARGDAWRSLALTLGVVSGTTCFAFGVMATSAIPVLRAIGVSVLAGTLLTLVACALVVSPAARVRTA